MKRTAFLALILFLGCQPQRQNPYLMSGDGFVDVEGGQIWYGIMGEGDQAPFVYLHGGPGGTSRAGLNLLDLSKDRPVILMDQLGSGLSTYHEDSTLLTVRHFVEQVKALKEALNLQEFYLTGGSWGTALALEYYMAYPDGIKGIVFNSPYFSTSTWIADTDTLISTLPDSVQRAIAIAEATHSFETESYLAAMDVFSDHFIFRIPNEERQKPSLGIFDVSYDTMSSRNSFIYNYMWGPSEFSPTGTLLSYENVDALSRITVPVLFTTGEFDEARPATVKGFASMVPNAKYLEIPNAGHVTMAHNADMIVEALRSFANRVDEER
ncbi:MAG: proline iminopeptidase-family hydrolase [Bacteroidota bacterium]